MMVHLAAAKGFAEMLPKHGSKFKLNVSESMGNLPVDDPRLYSAEISIFPASLGCRIVFSYDQILFVPIWGIQRLMQYDDPDVFDILLKTVKRIMRDHANEMRALTRLCTEDTTEHEPNY